MTDKTLRCYEIPDLFRTAMERAVDEETGELTEAGVAEIRALAMAADRSIADLACYIRELEMEADAVKAAMAAMAERAAKLGNRASKWRGYLLDTLDCVGSTGVKDPRIVVSVKSNPPSVQIDDGVEVPYEYRRIIPERIEPDKTALKAALKAGQYIPGVSLVSTRRIVIA